MKVFDILVGKKVKVMTDLKVEVELEIKSVKVHNHSQNLEPSTKENDWWPATKDWSTFEISFTNGSRKVYNSIEEINLCEL